MKTLTYISVLAAFVLVVTACSSNTATSSDSTDTNSTDTDPTDTDSTNTDPTDTNSEDATAEAGFSTDTHLTWILEVLRSPDDVEIDEIENRFTQDFLATVPANQIILTATPLAGEWVVIEDDEGEEMRNAVIAKDDSRLALTVAIDPTDDNRIAGLLLTPIAANPADATIESTDSAITSIGASNGYGIYETSSGTCTSIHDVRGDVVQPIGSEFKLWVLAAVAEQIQAGELAWDEKITLTADLRTVPGLGASTQPDGTEISVAELAQSMISVSDNYATDLLLDRVGREAVEHAMAASGVADPSRNIPMLTTREIFLLKFVPEHANYPSLNEDEKRAYLDDVIAGDTTLASLDLENLPQPPWNIEELEWFASPSDICRTYLHLADLAQAPMMEPLHQALTIQPTGAPAPVDLSRWTTQWFKGGSEPGLVAMSWYLADSDGNSYVVAGSISDPEVVIPELQAAAALQQAIALLNNTV